MKTELVASMEEGHTGGEAVVVVVVVKHHRLGERREDSRRMPRWKR